MSAMAMLRQMTLITTKRSVPTLLNYMERHAASEHTSGRCHGDVAGCRARRNRGSDVSIRNLEIRRKSVECDAGSICEALAEDATSLANLTERLHQADESIKAHIEAEDRTASVGGITSRVAPFEGAAASVEELGPRNLVWRLSFAVLGTNVFRLSGIAIVDLPLKAGTRNAAHGTV